MNGDATATATMAATSIASQLQGVAVQNSSRKSGMSLRSRASLRKRYGAGNWRKLKGTATIEYEDGRMCVAELHWYEAHGIGRKNFKVKRVLRPL